MISNMLLLRWITCCIDLKFGHFGHFWHIQHIHRSRASGENLDIEMGEQGVEARMRPGEGILKLPINGEVATC